MDCTKQFKIEFDVWCTDERHFNELVRELMCCHFSDNAQYGGYGFEVKLSEKAQKKLHKTLEFDKEVDFE